MLDENKWKTLEAMSSPELRKKIAGNLFNLGKQKAAESILEERKQERQQCNENIKINHSRHSLIVGYGGLILAIIGLLLHALR